MKAAMPSTQQGGAVAALAGGHPVIVVGEEHASLTARGGVDSWLRIRERIRRGAWSAIFFVRPFALVVTKAAAAGAG
jgi:hypothetical protein